MPRVAKQETAGADDGLKSLVKIVRILDCFSTVKRSLSLTELCAATGYPRSTTHRLVSSMREVGLLNQERQRDSYRLGLRPVRSWRDALKWAGGAYAIFWICLLYTSDAADE